MTLIWKEDLVFRPLYCKIEKNVSDTILALRETSEFFKSGFEAIESERKRLDVFHVELRQKEQRLHQKKHALQDLKKEIKVEREKLEKDKRRFERDRERFSFDREKLDSEKKKLFDTARYYPGNITGTSYKPLDPIEVRGKSVKRALFKDGSIPTSLSDEEDNTTSKEENTNIRRTIERSSSVQNSIERRHSHSRNLSPNPLSSVKTVSRPTSSDTTPKFAQLRSLSLRDASQLNLFQAQLLPPSPVTVPSGTKISPQKSPPKPYGLYQTASSPTSARLLPEDQLSLRKKTVPLSHAKSMISDNTEHTIESGQSMQHSKEPKTNSNHATPNHSRRQSPVRPRQSISPVKPKSKPPEDQNRGIHQDLSRKVAKDYPRSDDIDNSRRRANSEPNMSFDPHKPPLKSTITSTNYKTRRPKKESELPFFSHP
jgi:hypothetical protein